MITIQNASLSCYSTRLQGAFGVTIACPEASATAVPISSSLLYKTTVDPGSAPVTVTGVWV